MPGAARAAHNVAKAAACGFLLGLCGLIAAAAYGVAKLCWDYAGELFALMLAMFGLWLVFGTLAGALKVMRGRREAAAGFAVMVAACAVSAFCGLLAWALITNR